ncbi:hypothetical protein [Archangium lansingense]|uniref:Uncharacterized protein n=1 Tax=Archangium lansingense TaxID=2995310 RepID=A0ABT4AHX8_9BACT|nr:hypothetical protein [Archangium lansinium]MCY1081260.1 hypothetical protein [Archangium lansinium]
MPQQRERTKLQPRSEAGPIRERKQLTAEQDSAGDQASALLRAIAKASPLTRRPIPEARRFLPVIDEVRTNHIILLDGKRGSGKSALLLTLLMGYSETLLNGQPLPGFEDWFDPADRIVPVGHVDLQPQPASTNLLLLLMASLERVVHTLWPQRERGKPGAQPWHIPAPDEPTSLRYWRNFVRVAASSGGGNVQDRKKVLDPEAFALEQAKEDFRRLDLQTVFREFMDALTQDYLNLTHQSSGPQPLFLLAIDDADMNPWLSAGLLEVIRKLYHPRLAFLLTGDSSLFVEMLKQELARDVRRDSQPLTDDEKARYETLALEIYAKVIPQGHRCMLPALPEEERLSALPELEKFLRTIPIQPRRGVADKQPLSLRDYLQYGSQVREAMPERLRTLWDLYGELALADTRAKQTGAEDARAATAIETFWHSVLRDVHGNSELERNLREVIHRSRSKPWQLRIEEGLIATPSLRSWTTYPVGNGWRLVTETPEKFRLALRGKELDPQTTAAIILATDFAADDIRGAFGARSPAILGLRIPVFAHGIGSLAQGVQIVAPWLIPEWASFEDLYELKESWELGLIFTDERPTIPDYLARHFLSSVLSVGKRPRFATKSALEANHVAEATSKSEQDYVLLDWAPLAEKLVALTRRPNDSPRLSSMSEWAISRAGLLAAPESGLPPKVANEFLRVLRTAFGKNWEQVRRELRKTRRARLALNPLQEDIPTDKNTSIQQIDELFPEHEFGNVVEQRSSQRATDHMLGEFRNALNSVRIRWLRSITGESGSASLLTYLTPYRLNLLEDVPPSFFSPATEILLRHQNISGEATPALMALWRFACDWSGVDEHVRNAVREERGTLVIDQRFLNGISGEERLVATYMVGTDQTAQRVRLWATEEFQTEMSTLQVWAARSRLEELTPLLEVLLRMVHDYSMDQQGRSNPMLFASTKRMAWPGTKFHYMNHDYFPWMIPGWQTLLEKELLELAWNERVADVKNANPSGARGEGGQYVDALAYWLLRSNQLLFRRGNLERELNMALTPYDWEQVIKPYFQKQGEPHQSRDSVFNAWIEELPLMAAPEYGLSQVAAEALLNSVIESTLAKEIDLPGYWHQRREKRLVQAGVPEARVKDFLRSMDDERKDHPWVSLMGKPRPPRSGPAGGSRKKPPQS